jgi:hypothetical protein
VAASDSHLNLAALEKLVDAVFAGVTYVTSGGFTKSRLTLNTPASPTSNHAGLHGLARNVH